MIITEGTKTKKTAYTPNLSKVADKIKDGFYQITKFIQKPEYQGISFYTKEFRFFLKFETYKPAHNDVLACLDVGSPFYVAIDGDSKSLTFPTIIKHKENDSLELEIEAKLYEPTLNLWYEDEGERKVWKHTGQEAGEDNKYPYYLTLPTQYEESEIIDLDELPF